MELAARSGKTRPLDHRIAALLLSRHKTIEPKLHGITLTFHGERFIYWSPNSIVLSNVGSPKLAKVRAYYDPENMSRIHLLSLSGAYIETLPLKEHIDPLKHTEQNKRILAETKRANNRHLEVLRAARRPDIAEAIDTALANAAAIERSVTQLPAAPSRHEQSVEPDLIERESAPAVPAASRVVDAIEAADRRHAAEERLLDRAAIAERQIAPQGRRNSVPAVPSAPSRQNVPAAFDPFDLD